MNGDTGYPGNSYCIVVFCVKSLSSALLVSLLVAGF